MQVDPVEPLMEHRDSWLQTTNKPNQDVVITEAAPTNPAVEPAPQAEVESQLTQESPTLEPPEARNHDLHEADASENQDVMITEAAPTNPVVEPVPEVKSQSTQESPTLQPPEARNHDLDEALASEPRTITKSQRRRKRRVVADAANFLQRVGVDMCEELNPMFLKDNELITATELQNKIFDAALKRHPYLQPHSSATTSLMSSASSSLPIADSSAATTGTASALSYMFLCF